MKMRVFLILSLFSAVYADDAYRQKPLYLRVNDAVGSSFIGSGLNSLLKPLCYVNQKYIIKMSDETFVAPEYHHFVVEAQRNLGISEKKILPIVNLNPDRRLHKGAHLLAVAEPNCVLVNQESMQNASHGVKRAVLHHEAAHVKYNDKTAVIYPLLMTGLAQVAVLRKVPFYSRARLNAFLYLTQLPAILFNFKVLAPMIERRADIEGCYATQCEQCVKEFTDVCCDSRSDHGYLTRAEMNNIAKDLKGQRCDMHAPSWYHKTAESWGLLEV